MSQDEEIAMQDVMKASRYVGDCIYREVGSQLDLEESLEASRYASQPYSTPPREWPPLVEVGETTELPSVLLERYSTAGGEGTALCGIFPEIRRAWASVDNSLFLWRFDKSVGHCIEYTGEEAICAVGLAKCRPGVLIETIRYLLVLATPVEVILVGVCCTEGPDGDPLAEISVCPLPDYTISSDGVTMTCVTCTNKGRIFMAGLDGHIYELLYTTGSGWYKRCRKVCLTAGVGSILRWVVPNVFKFRAVDPVVKMVVDNERQILYACTEQMKLQAYVFEPNGEGHLKKVAEERNILNQISVSQGNRQSPAAPGQSSKPSVVSISPLSTLESRRLHLVVMLSDGRRMYITTSINGSGGNISFIGFNNHCLKVVTTRPSLPLGVCLGLPFEAASRAARTQNEHFSTQVETSNYSAGTIVLSNSPPATMSSLLVVSRDLRVHCGSSGPSSRRSWGLQEVVSSLPIEGRMLSAADVPFSAETASFIQSLYPELEYSGLEVSGESACEKIWARGDLSVQHILPRRKIVVFTSMGMMELVFNRPVDVLRRILESNSSRPLLEDFFTHFGADEAAAMCLMLAAQIITFDKLVSNIVADKAAEAFEDPRMVGLPQFDSSSGFSNTRIVAGGFRMGQVIQETELIFSGALKGLCLCTSRLLFPLWTFSVMSTKSNSVTMAEDDLVSCRLSISAMNVLETKLRSLEKFLKSRRKQRRGLNERVDGSGYANGSILYRPHSEFETYSNGVESANKRQRLYNPAQLAAMEAKAIDSIRQLLLRSAEALFLLQLLSQNHARLVQGLDASLKQALVNLTFHQLVCSKEGDQIATKLITTLMEYYTGSDVRRTVEDVSAWLREGCPSYFKESYNKFFLAVECLDRATLTSDAQEKEKIAREAFSFLSKVSASVDLRPICKRFEELRFYEAVVYLPLQMAQTLDPAGNAFNQHIDASIREDALTQRKQCYEIIVNALRSLASSELDEASRRQYIYQIVHFGLKSTDGAFREYLYTSMIELGLENELLEYGGLDLEPFLQKAGSQAASEVEAVSSGSSPLDNSGGKISSNQAKYVDLLAKFYVLKKQHVLAAHLFLRLAERSAIVAEDNPTLDQRREYLRRAVLQAKNVGSYGLAGSDASERESIDLFEGKLVVLEFQMKIKEEFEAMASAFESSSAMEDDPELDASSNDDSAFANTAKEKAEELSLELKSITELYNQYALPFQFWEICLEMLYYFKHSSDAGSNIINETWTRLIDQALSEGGVGEACKVLKRVGSNIKPADGFVIPLNVLCLRLEKAAFQSSERNEYVGDEEIARALLAASKGAAEPVLNAYEQTLYNLTTVPSPDLRIRLFRSVLVVLLEWAKSVLSEKMGSVQTRSSLLLRGSFAPKNKDVVNQEVRDKIANAANRYMTEIRRLALPLNKTETVYAGFKELDQSLLPSFSF